MGSGYVPRLSIELGKEQYKALQKIIPWGMQRSLFSAIVDDIILMSSEGDGERLIAAIVAGLVRPREVLPTLMKKGD